MKITPLLLSVLLTLPSLAASADFEEPNLSRRTDDGRVRICAAPLGDVPARCVTVVPVNKDLNSAHLDLKVTKLVLNEAALEHRPDGTTHFGGVIEWAGRGAGLLSIAGPAGRLLALGHVIVEDGGPALRIDDVCDESLSQQFDRMVFFGETDAMQVRLRTKIWLEAAVNPALPELLGQAPAALIARP